MAVSADVCMSGERVTMAGRVTVTESVPLTMACRRVPVRTVSVRKPAQNSARQQGEGAEHGAHYVNFDDWRQLHDLDHFYSLAEYPN